MRDWKIRQEMYHRLEQDYSDDLNDVDIVYRTTQLSKDIEDYIKLSPEEMGWVYPAKSYVVAVCYAYWLSKDFNEDFYDLLNDEDLLYKNDPHFVPYHKHKEIYDKLISTFELPLPQTGVVPHIRAYYLSEFMIDE